MDLMANLTKSLNDILKYNEVRFNEQAKLIQDLQKQLESVVVENKELNEKYDKLSDENKQLIEQQKKYLDENKNLSNKQDELNEKYNKLTSENKQLIDQQDKFITDSRKQFTEFQDKLTEDNNKLQNQMNVFNKHIKVEEISKWIKITASLGDEVIKLIESNEETVEKLKLLNSDQEHKAKLLKEQENQLSLLITRVNSFSLNNNNFNHNQSPKYGSIRYDTQNSGVLSPTNNNIIVSSLNNEHQLYHNNKHNHLYHNHHSSNTQPPFYRNSNFVDTIDPNDELTVISDKVEDLRRSVNELNILQRSFEESSSICSHD